MFLLIIHTGLHFYIKIENYTTVIEKLITYQEIKKLRQHEKFTKIKTNKIN